MKTTFRILVAGLAASLALVSCDKESLTKTDNGASKDGVRTITVSFADVTRSELNGFQPKFKANDEIKVSNGSKSETCTVSVDDKGVASITIKDSELQKAELTAVYPAAAWSDSEPYFTVSADKQDGSFAMANICKATIPAGSKDAVFENQTAILKFSVPAKGAKGIDYSPKTIKVVSRGENNLADENKTITINGKESDGSIKADGGFYYMAVLPGETISKLTICSGEGMRCPTASGTLAANTIYDVALPVLNGYEYVELTMTVGGTPKTLKWATMNVGATETNPNGLYFAWGETTGHEANDAKTAFKEGYSFSWSNAPFNNGQSSYDETFFGSVKDTVCPNGVLALDNDAAYVNWGGSWRMPTREELAGLAALDNKGWDNTDKGYRLTDANGNSIFLPAAGYGYGTALSFAGGVGYYWSSSLRTVSPGPGNAFNLNFGSSNVYTDYSDRYFGYSVRPLSE